MGFLCLVFLVFWGFFGLVFKCFFRKVSAGTKGGRGAGLMLQTHLIHLFFHDLKLASCWYFLSLKASSSRWDFPAATRVDRASFCRCVAGGLGVNLTCQFIFKCWKGVNVFFFLVIIGVDWNYTSCQVIIKCCPGAPRWKTEKECLPNLHDAVNYTWGV